jgi:suppressor of fused protein SUFU
MILAVEKSIESHGDMGYKLRKYRYRELSEPTIIPGRDTNGNENHNQVFQRKDILKQRVKLMGFFDRFKSKKNGDGEAANDDWIEIREAHYEKHFGELTEQVMHSTDIKEVHVDIYQFRPTPERDYWTIITGGMSDARQYIPEDLEGQIGSRAEIMMYVREPNGWMFNVLKGLAEMPFDDNTYLHWRHTVPNGKPMTAEPSELTNFFFLPPYFEAEGFDSLELDGEGVDILWLFPITDAERQYAVDNGSEALEELFEKTQIDPVVDEARKSIV